MGTLSGGVRLSLPQIYSGLRDTGLGHTEASNLAGVLYHESGGYTGSFGGQPTENGGVLNPGGAYGLAQFNGSRQGQLANYATSVGGSPSDPQTQLGFIAQDAQNRGINLGSTSDIVNRYEIPKVSLRAGEIASADRYAAQLDPNSYTAANSNQAGDGLGYGSGSVETSLGLQIQSESYTADSGSVVFANGDDNTGAGIGGAIDGASFSQANVSSGVGTGSFGLGGIMSGGSAVGAGNSGDGGTSGQTAAGSMTVPQAIDKQTSAETKQAAQDTASLNKQTAANTKSVTDKAQGIFDTVSGSLSDYFVRAVFVIVGLIALAAALMMFRPVQEAAASVARKVPV